MSAGYWKRMLTLQRPGAIVFAHYRSRLVTLLFCSSKPPCYPPTRSLNLVNLNVEEAPYVNSFCPCRGPVSCNLSTPATSVPSSSSLFPAVISTGQGILQSSVISASGQHLSVSTDSRGTVNFSNFLDSHV
jgi:hypothetical protein